MKKVQKWRTFKLFIANFFATKIMGGDKELAVLLLLGGNI
jgi:hypothetical protein